jgi:hypothetical protein
MMAETIFNFLLFILSFLLSYAFLRKSKIFPNSVNVILGIIIAFYVIFASIYYQEDLMQLVAYSLLFLFGAFVVILIILGFKGKKK